MLLLVVTNCARSLRTPLLNNETSVLCGSSKRFVKQFKQCGLSCNQVIEFHDTTPPSFISRLPMKNIAVKYAELNRMEEMMLIPTGSDSCTANVTLSYFDSLPWWSYSPQGGFNFSRTWTLTDECGNNASAQHRVFVSASQCPAATPWGQDCSCTSSPPAVNAVCTGGVWNIVGDVHASG